MSVVTIFLDITSANLRITDRNSESDGLTLFLLAESSFVRPFFDHEGNDLCTANWGVWIDRNDTSEIGQDQVLGCLTYDDVQSGPPGCTISIHMAEDSFAALYSVIQAGDKKIEVSITVDGVDSNEDTRFWNPIINPSLPVFSFEFCVSFPVPGSED